MHPRVSRKHILIFRLFKVSNNLNAYTRVRPRWKRKGLKVRLLACVPRASGFYSRRPFQLRRWERGRRRSPSNECFLRLFRLRLRELRVSDRRSARQSPFLPHPSERDVINIQKGWNKHTRTHIYVFHALHEPWFFEIERFSSFASASNRYRSCLVDIRGSSEASGCTAAAFTERSQSSLLCSYDFPFYLFRFYCSYLFFFKKNSVAHNVFCPVYDAP